MASPDAATTQPPASASAANDGLPVPRRHYATLAIMATMVLVVLDGAIAVRRANPSSQPRCLSYRSRASCFGIFQTPNNRNMLLSAPQERSGATEGMQGTARLLGETAGAVIMTVLFTLTSPVAAPRIGLAVAAVLAFAAGLVSAMRIGRAVPLNRISTVQERTA